MHELDKIIFRTNNKNNNNASTRDANKLQL